jgi:hypothetical protein
LELAALALLVVKVLKVVQAVMEEITFTIIKEE